MNQQKTARVFDNDEIIVSSAFTPQNKIVYIDFSFYKMVKIRKNISTDGCPNNV